MRSPFSTPLSVSSCLAALGLCLAGAGCLQAEEPEGFGKYPGPAVGSDTPTSGGDGDAGDSAGNSTGADTGGSSGSTSGGGGSGGGTGVGSSTGASTGVSGTGGTSGTTGGGTTGANTTGGATTGGATTGGGGSNTGSSSGGGATTGGGSGGVSSLSFSVLTKPLGGEYAPRNVGAIWITNSSGVFVKTLERWADRRLQYLKLFAQQTNRNVVDAVTSATLTSHRVHTVSWDLKDLNGNVVPDGPYNVVIETSDHTTDSLTLPFTKGVATSSTPADVAHYVQMTLKVQ